MKYVLVVLSILVLSCKQEKKYHDITQEKKEKVKDTLLAGIIEWQKELNEEYEDPETSPLPDRYRKDFKTLDFFEPDTTFVVIADFERTPEAIPFLMPTTTDRQSEEVVYGIATFILKGKKHKLEIYQNRKLMLQEEYKDYLFLPFIDKTNGKQTYGGGRYIDLSIPEGNTIVINFNKAYNPYCAYNKKYSCPIVPGINSLDIEVLAGVKAFKPTKK
ncbi:hypothetical protein CLV91_2477 [Maribacter vaceletii]|uniref:DUF1684 domain-containing protein n=1 Tax=Maribacter vaceletii TaxID=1206816 RepID=A0A495E6P5_9FLAO|nr:DUF1684 domain-containing protein [Maribacter vaceletii]RKR12351.1 hypothetical protein CLV91_2477 [Maribacter vaceletii]